MRCGSSPAQSGLGCAAGMWRAATSPCRGGCGVELDLSEERNPRMHFAEASVVA